MITIAATPNSASVAAASSAARTRFGIKAKLLLAFAALAGLTAVASAVAWLVFEDTGRAATHLARESLPRIETALTLAQTSGEIAVAAPALMAARSQAERIGEQARLASHTRALEALIQEVEATPGSLLVSERLSTLFHSLVLHLADLDQAIERRLDLQSDLADRVGTLASVHARFLTAIEPIVDDAVFDLVLQGDALTDEGAEALTTLVDDGVGTVDRLLALQAEANLALALLAEALLVEDVVRQQPIEEEFDAAAAAAERSLAGLGDPVALRGALAELLAFGRGSDGAFSRHRHHLHEGNDEGWKTGFVEALKAAHERLLLVLVPEIDDAAFDLVMATEDVTEQSAAAVTKLIDAGARLLQLVLTLRAEVNLAAGLLDRAALAGDVVALEPLYERFEAAMREIDRVLVEIPAEVELVDVRSAVAMLGGLGRAEDGLFALRRGELEVGERAEATLDASRNLAVALGDEVATIVRAARDESHAAAARSTDAIRTGQSAMAILSAVGVVGAGLVVLFYVGPRVVRPIEDITEAMAELAGGDTTIDIPGRDRGDELGRMAQALGVFRDTAIEVQRSNLREIEAGRRRLSQAIESISEGFSLYDADDRLVVCNSMYRTLLYPEMADEIEPGMTFESVVRRAIKRGFIKDALADPEGWLAERLARHRRPGGPNLQQRGDGRWIMVSERKTDDGSTVAVYSDITNLKERERELSEKSLALEQLSNQLAKYLDPQVFESIFVGRQEVNISSKRKKLTVFFSDVEGFTEISDRMESEDVTQLLNHYLTEMSGIALAHGATIDKYVGDGIVIFFGDPETRGVKEDALACVRMAIAMRDRMRELEGYWRSSGVARPLRSRIGVNTGFCTVGNFGSESRMDYTIIGSGANVASRLESAAEPGEILISYETFAHVRDEIACEARGNIPVKGIAYPVAVYRVIGVDEGDGAIGRIQERLPGLDLSVDVAAMSDEERTRAAQVLRDALGRIGD